MQEISRIGQDFLHYSFIRMKCCPSYPLLDKYRKREEMSHFGKQNITMGNLIFGPV